MTAFRTARLSGALVVLLALMLISTGVVAAGGGEGRRELRDVRRATAQFRNIDVATAAGYGRFPDAAGIACIANPPLGTMGIHYVNGDYVGNAVVDPLKPEALVYEPREHGRLKLVALEYIVFQAAWDAENASPPSLFGHEFGLVGDPNRYGIPAFYELHVWLFKHNPSGMFFEWNPRVSCNPGHEDDD